MLRPLRPIAEGLVYRVINRGNGRQPVFFQGGDYLAFLKAIVDLKDRKPFAMYGYCLITNQIHQSPPDEEFAAIRRKNETGLPFGEARWVTRLAKRLDLDLTIRPRGRPKRQPTEPMATKPRATCVRNSSRPCKDSGRTLNSEGPSSAPTTM